MNIFNALFSGKIPPVSYVTLAIIAGIIIQKTAALPLYILYTQVSIVLCCILGLFVFKKESFLSASLTVGFLMALFAAITFQQRVDTFYNTQSLLANKKITVSGTIVDISDGNKKSGIKQITVITNSITLVDENKTIPIKTTISIYTYNLQNASIGNAIKTPVIIEKNINNSSFKDFLIKEGIQASFFIPKISSGFIIPKTYSWLCFIPNMRRNFVKKISKRLPHSCKNLFCSLFLGQRVDKSEFSPTADLFRMWGLSHYLARSGLHVVLFILGWRYILRLIPLHIRIKNLFLLILMSIYTILSWTSVSFLRAIGTFFIAKIHTFNQRPIHFLHILSLVCSITLLQNPFNLFFLDFQLSFGLTFALGLFSQLRPIYKK